jgi:hypothetical protein
LQFATEVRADVERRAGGAVGQNMDHHYRLTAGQIAYLAALGVPPALLEQWLAQMNSRRTFAGSANGRAYTARYAGLNGAIRAPVLTMHDIVDGLVLPSQETEYRNAVTAAGKGGDLRQVYVQAIGHCSFTGEEWLAAVRAMQRRLERRRWPSDTELAALFPFSPPALRFVPFNPGPFPQPPSE